MRTLRAQAQRDHQQRPHGLDLAAGGLDVLLDLWRHLQRTRIHRLGELIDVGGQPLLAQFRQHQCQRVAVLDGPPGRPPGSDLCAHRSWERMYSPSGRFPASSFSRWRSSGVRRSEKGGGRRRLGFPDEGDTAPAKAPFADVMGRGSLMALAPETEGHSSQDRRPRPGGLRKAGSRFLRPGPPLNQRLTAKLSLLPKCFA